MSVNSELLSDSVQLQEVDGQLCAPYRVAVGASSCRCAGGHDGTRWGRTRGTAMDQEDEIDPRFELRLGAGRPLPEAIADKIRELVDNGTFKPGSKLPNESELARNMRVARSSVRTALQRLEAHGVCEGKRGVGWYVRRAPVPRAPAVRRALRPASGTPCPICSRSGSAWKDWQRAWRPCAPRPASSTTSPSSTRSTSTPATTATSCCAPTSPSTKPSSERVATTCCSRRTSRIVGELADWRYRSYAEPGVPLRSRARARQGRPVPAQPGPGRRPGGDEQSPSPTLRRAARDRRRAARLDRQRVGASSPNGAISAATYSYRPIRVVM